MTRWVQARAGNPFALRLTQISAGADRVPVARLAWRLPLAQGCLPDVAVQRWGEGRADSTSLDWNGRPDVGSLNHLIRPCEERRRNGQAERLRSLEIDDQLELRGLLHG